MPIPRTIGLFAGQYTFLDSILLRKSLDTKFMHNKNII